jgi:hypothetical protein
LLLMVSSMIVSGLEGADAPDAVKIKQLELIVNIIDTMIRFGRRSDW